jgi:hypothetical protein
MLVDLESSVLPANRAEVRRQLEVLDKMIVKAFADSDEREFAFREDRQGIGGASRPPGGDDAGG